MPLKFDGKTFATFEDAVSYCMRVKNMSRDSAKKYVGAIQAKQE